MKKLKVFYDHEEDILHIGEEGVEEEFVEIYPGVNVELNAKGKVIGIEIFKASNILKDVIKPIEKKLRVA